MLAIIIDCIIVAIGFILMFQPWDRGFEDWDMSTVGQLIIVIGIIFIGVNTILLTLN